MRVMLIDGFLEIFKALSAQPDVELVALGRPQDLQKIADGGIDCPSFPYTTRAKVDLKATRIIRDAIRESKPDLIHAFASRPLANAVLATTWMKDPPKLVSYRGIVAGVSRLDPANWLTYLHPRVAGHACVVNATKQGLIASGVAPERCVTTYDCVRAGRLERLGRAGLADWDIPEDAFVVGTVAAIRPIKGIDILLRAAIECADLKDVYWVLIGPVNDPIVEELSRDERIQKRVRLLGMRSDARELISGADLFVMPSRSEGICLALLEAMSQSICPVVSDAGGMKEIVRHGQDGLVVPKEDVSALAAAIRSLRADRDRVAAFAESSCQRITEMFTPAKMGQRTLELYRTVMMNRARHQGRTRRRAA